MNRKTTICALVLAVLCSLPLAARRPSYYRHGGLTGDNYHFGYVTGMAGYGMIRENISDMRSVGAVSGGVGLGYEFRNSGFWTSIGANYFMHRTTAKFDTYNGQVTGLDTDGQVVTLQYRLRESEKLYWNFFEVPLMFGYYNHGFYIGVGPKIRFGVKSQLKASGDFDLSGLYSDDQGGVAVDETSSNPAVSGYQNYKFSGNREDIKLKTGVSLSGEIGYDVLSNAAMYGGICHVLKIGVYFDCGLASIVAPAQKDVARVTFNTPSKVTGYMDATHPTVNSFFTSRVTKSDHVIPFYVGLKVTYMIGGSRTAHGGLHHGCQCYN